MAFFIRHFIGHSFDFQYLVYVLREANPIDSFYTNYMLETKDFTIGEIS